MAVGGVLPGRRGCSPMRRSMPSRTRCSDSRRMSSSGSSSRQAPACRSTGTSGSSPPRTRAPPYPVGVYDDTSDARSGRGWRSRAARGVRFRVLQQVSRVERFTRHRLPRRRNSRRAPRQGARRRVPRRTSPCRRSACRRSACRRWRPAPLAAARRYTSRGVEISLTAACEGIAALRPR